MKNFAFKKLQKDVKEYDKLKGWEKDDESEIVLHMIEELGEISREILRYRNYKKHEEFSKDKLAEEIIDMLYLIIKLANKFSLNLDEEWEKLFERYKIK